MSIEALNAFWSGRLQRVKSQLEENNFAVWTAWDLDEAKSVFWEEIFGKVQPASVSFGGSMTVVNSGLYEELKQRDGLEVIDTYDTSLPLDEFVERRRRALLVDLYLTGTNAVTGDGHLVNLDGLGNRVAAMTFGPKHVALLIGRNKIVPDLESSVDRIKQFAAPANADSVLSARGMDPAADSLPGIVVIHEWWGLNDNIRTATRRLAGQGYRALAVDVYQGATATSSDSAQALMQRAMSQREQVMANLQDAHDYLRTEAGAPRVAVMGWCFGGGRTFDAVAAAPTQYDAAVAYYGTPESMTTAVLRKTTTPILAHFGRKDQAVSVESARDFQTRFQDVGAEGSIYFYDAGHAFANPSGESYVSDAAEQAWSRTTDFLSQYLYP